MKWHHKPFTLFGVSAQCPYSDKDCPKIEDIKASDRSQDRRIANIERILYVIVGMIAINWGISLW